jgi:hypothetical protein
VGDRILAVEGRPIAEWLSDDPLDARPGDVLRYEVLRQAPGLDRQPELAVPLTPYPVTAAVAANPHRVVIVVGLLMAGSFLLWRGAPTVPAVATLVAGSAAGVGLTAPPFGPQAVDLVTGQFAPYAVGGVAIALALGAALAAAACFPTPPDWLGRRRWAVWLVPLVPLFAYVPWLLYADRLPEPARLQAGLDVSMPAALTAAAVAVPILAHNYHRAAPRARVALRLVVVAALVAALLAGVLHVAPMLLRGEPLVPWPLLALLLVPLVLVCWVAAVLEYRLLEIDAVLRRSLLQLVIATLLGALFLAGVGAASVTSSASVASMVTGGIVVLILLPLALLLRRTVGRLAYGARADPDRVVSRLRRLDPATGPEDALRETLELLSRSFGLSYAAIETFGDTEKDRFQISRGEPREQPTSVVLEVAGQPLGRLDMEVSVMREPFGSRDHAACAATCMTGWVRRWPPHSCGSRLRRS